MIKEDADSLQVTGNDGLPWWQTQQKANPSVLMNYISGSRAYLSIMGPSEIKRLRKSVFKKEYSLP